MTPGLFDDEPTQGLIELGVFDYRLLSADTRVFVLEKTDETQWLLKKTAENIILIGKNLQAVKAKLPHGMFLPWLKSEFGMSRQSADNFAHVAERFGDKMLNFSNLATSALYALASPSVLQEARDEAIQRADSGEKITHTLAKQIIDAQEALKKAQEAEAQARADALVTQQQLFHARSDLTNQIEALQRQIADIQKPDEITVTVWPEEKQREIEVLTAQIEKLQSDIESEKRAVPPDVSQQLKTLEAQVKQLETMRKTQEERIEKQEEDLKLAIEKRERSDSADQMRKKWHMVTSEVTTSMMRLLAQWPSPVDLRSFESDEWVQLTYLKEVLRRVLDECEDLHIAPVSSGPHALRSLRVQANGVEG